MSNTHSKQTHKNIRKRKQGEAHTMKEEGNYQGLDGWLRLQQLLEEARRRRRRRRSSGSEEDEVDEGKKGWKKGVEGV